MTSKNPTHIRGLYDVNDWYDAHKYHYHYYINSDSYRKDEIRYRTRDIRRFYNLRNKYRPGDKTLFYQNAKNGKRKTNSSKTKKYRRYQVAVQTSDSLLFDDSDFEKMVNLFENERYNDDLFLFPYLKRRLMIKYFRLWQNRFCHVCAFKLQHNLLIMNNNDDYKSSSDASEPEFVINFDFESGDTDDETVENNQKDKSIILQYGPDDHGIKDVTFKVM